MSHVARTGIAIGISCAVWMFVMGFTGWYRDPVMLNAFWVVVAIEIGLLVWGLRCTAATRGYWGQVGAGTAMAIIGAVIIFGASVLFTAVVFPDYFHELRAIQEQILRDSGMAEGDIQARLQAGAAMRTPVMNALQGFVGTVVTGFVASLVIAAFTRRRT